MDSHVGDEVTSGRAAIRPVAFHYFVAISIRYFHILGGHKRVSFGDSDLIRDNQLSKPFPAWGARSKFGRQRPQVEPEADLELVDGGSVSFALEGVAPVVRRVVWRRLNVLPSAHVSCCELVDAWVPAGLIGASVG
jgi:hypothetical protein